MITLSVLQVNCVNNNDALVRKVYVVMCIIAVCKELIILFVCYLIFAVVEPNIKNTKLLHDVVSNNTYD